MCMAPIRLYHQLRPAFAINTPALNRPILSCPPLLSAMPGPHLELHLMQCYADVGGLRCMAKRVLDEFIPVVDWLAPPWASRSSGPKLMAAAAPRIGPNRLRALGRRPEAGHGKLLQPA